MKNIDYLKKNKVKTDILDYLHYGDIYFSKGKFNFLRSLYFVKNDKRTKVKKFFNKTVYVKNLDL